MHGDSGAHYGLGIQSGFLHHYSPGSFPLFHLRAPRNQYGSGASTVCVCVRACVYLCVCVCVLAVNMCYPCTVIATGNSYYSQCHKRSRHPIQMFKILRSCSGPHNKYIEVLCRQQESIVTAS